MKYDLYVGIWKLYDPYYRNTKSFDTLDAAEKEAINIGMRVFQCKPLFRADCLYALAAAKNVEASAITESELVTFCDEVNRHKTITFIVVPENEDKTLYPVKAVDVYD